MPVGGIPFGHFVLHRRIARGGMAEVFLARQRGLEGFDRRVAVKRILPHLSERPDFVKMFLDEARLAARLSHPNIVHIYEFGKVDQDYFIAMEYVDGVHTGQLIRLAATEPLPPVLVARIGADAASALAFAHRLEDADGTALAVVHRDISPQNLMLSFDGVVKLVDFGIAKAATAGDETQPGVVKGKYAYMSPEQTVGKSLDGRSDVFSLALVLWEMLAGRHLVSRGDPGEGMRALRDGRFPPIEQVVPTVPPELAAAIGHALALDREQRSTAAELGVALEAFIKASPDLATAMHLADWIKTRFERNTTGSLPALETGGKGTRRGAATPQHTLAASATHASSVSSAAAPVALPPREATIIDAAAFGSLGGLGALGDPDDDDEPPTDVVDDATALVAAARPPRRATTAPPRPRPRSSLPWAIALIAVVAIGGSVVIALRGGEPPRAAAVPVDAGTDVTALAADAAPAGDDANPEADDADADADPEADDAAEVDDELIEIEIEPDPPDAEPARALASLDVLTAPAGALVRLPGHDVAAQRSPATFLDLPPGALALRVELDGHMPLTRTVTLDAGQRRTLDLVLTRKPRSSRGSGDRVRPEKKPAVGTLNVRTTPYSVVYAAGKKLGETPFVIQLPAGTYGLTFKNPTLGTRTRRVVIKPAQTTKLKFDL